MQLSLMAFAAAAIVTTILGLLTLPVLRRLKIGQTIRAAGPKSHLTKAGTPTMGGIMFVLAMVLMVLVFSRGSLAAWLWLFVFLGSAAVGFCDDILKVVWRRSLGLTAKQKLLGQFAVILLFLLAANHFLGRGTDLAIPLFNRQLQLGWLYYVVVSIFLVGLINGVNLNDGLDGLAGGVSLLVFMGFWLMFLAAVSAPPLERVNYQEMANLAAAMAGCCLGFLVFNHHPAKVFMGDTGSLALGGAVAAFAVLLRAEVVLIVLGGVYLLEAVSVIMQVTSFRLFGKRIFRMSPLHHHFEAVWGERKTVAFFWLLAAICVALALLIFSL